MQQLTTQLPQLIQQIDLQKLMSLRNVPQQRQTKNVLPTVIQLPAKTNSISIALIAFDIFRQLIISDQTIKGG